MGSENDSENDVLPEAAKHKRGKRSEQQLSASKKHFDKLLAVHGDLAARQEKMESVAHSQVTATLL